MSCAGSAVASDFQRGSAADSRRLSVDRALANDTGRNAIGCSFRCWPLLRIEPIFADRGLNRGADNPRAAAPDTAFEGAGAGGRSARKPAVSGWRRIATSDFGAAVRSLRPASGSRSDLPGNPAPPGNGAGEAARKSAVFGFGPDVAASESPKIGESAQTRRTPVERSGSDTAPVSGRKSGMKPARSG